MNQEVELKLAIAHGDAARLRRHPLLKGIKPVRRKLYGIYFDTPDFDLFRMRGAFRLRREGYHWVQTLKLETGTSAGLSSRPEWEVQVTGNQPDFDVLPEIARQHLTSKLASRLQAAFVTDFQRTTWLLERPEGSVEIALDLGHVRAGDNDLPVSELELELKSGDSRLLLDIALEFLETIPLLPEYRSKALRGYQLSGVWQQKPEKAAPADMADRPPAAEAWRRMLLGGLSQLSRNLPGFLHEDDPEYLHQMRVAVRRMRTMLSLGKHIGQERDDWSGELRWFMGELSVARDWDVMVTETLAAVQDALPGDDRLEKLVSAAQKQRGMARARAGAAVENSRLARLLLVMTRDLIEEQSNGPALKTWAAGSLDRRFRQFKRLAGQFDELDIEERHQLRITAKHLRYAGEAFAALYGKIAGRYLADVARLQDGLGVANDVAIAQGLLAELVAGNRRLDHAASLSQGFITGASSSHVKEMGKLAARILAARPFWRQDK